jgi:hypothetical protein
MTNGNERGNTVDRARRRAWLLSPDSGFGGDGVKVPCAECGAMVNDRTIVVDRYPVPRHQGGRYVRGNIRPHCQGCSTREGGRTRHALARERSPYGDDDMCKLCGEHYLADHAYGCENDVAVNW